MNKKQPKLKFEEDKERTATRSPPKKEKVEQTQPRKKLKLDADKAAEKAQHLRFGKAEITPDEASRMTKQQKRAMYAAAAARSAPVPAALGAAPAWPSAPSFSHSAAFHPRSGR